MIVPTSADLRDQEDDQEERARRDESRTRSEQTRAAFDSVAAIYDGPFGNNGLIQRMRATLVAEVAGGVPPGSRLLDLGCGTGIDAVALAERGYDVVATDTSPEMVERSRERARASGLGARLRALPLAIEEIGRLAGERFDAVYSDLGPLNCVPDLGGVARDCAQLLRPGGLLVASVMGRVCPWEVVYYSARLAFGRARIRWVRGATPVGLNGHIVWTRYYTPREFYRAFAPHFELRSYRGLCLFLPPPYLIGFCNRLPAPARALAWLDDHAATRPLLRDAGDHFLMVLVRHG
jgi:2-polyprenyl-3-methyl-5-hydroxy-6-metoxy-1,4-benzoquinol methylase